MFGRLREDLRTTLGEIREAGLFKDERVLKSPQRAAIQVASGNVLNFCANNYLGLADHPALVESAQRALTDWGFGMASVRFICGTQEPHKELERRLSQFLGTDDTILYSSCFDANGGLFETLLSDQDTIISDELNHASIIDGIRLSKARRLRYRNRDMADLEAQLQSAQDARYRLIATDGVFSMDGYLAPLDEITALAEKYNALVMVDDSHAVGFMGATGAGTPEHFGVGDKVDIYTGTLGKALGGASGGYVAAHQEIVDVLRQRSRPYLFSNSLAPSITAAALTALDLITPDLLDRLRANATHFRTRMTEAGFDLLAGEHPIIPVMIGDAAEAGRMADLLLAQGIYVIGFSYPVVPHGKARIRTQMSAAHTAEDIDRAVEAFIAARALMQPDNT
ncbi:2-amino-3-ketobutyrate coenzyme A ligase [Actinokineospora spheciospongiae]|uniref:2-amino-3-ketobutyrate coenzyme A ligase n=1 Tax=Actinokineospora spheciospongiae TaxID=909613 RepID=W7IPB0_9PSEU|nr:glycine C-acetyltransferase [Actinokineospora spheciospongiae]EWC58396.1 2-amino-3-ketobutyrate coenzyme A ligase [Actinokineospora spheciospongiae]